jgi:uncharacterized protein YbjT (DUF2867 family)
MATALIAGATGLTGRNLLRELLEADEYDRVISVARRTIPQKHPKLVQVDADFGALEKISDALRGADDAFCCLGTTMKVARSREAFRAVDQGAVTAFAWAAQRAGARRFFTVSSVGADPNSRIFYNRVKGETEQALQVLRFSTLAIFRPGPIKGQRIEPRVGEAMMHGILWFLEPLMFGRLRRYRPIAAETIARAMLRCSYGTGARGLLVFESDEIEDLGR